MASEDGVIGCLEPKGELSSAAEYRSADLLFSRAYGTREPYHLYPAFLQRSKSESERQIKAFITCIKIAVVIGRNGDRQTQEVTLGLVQQEVLPNNSHLYLWERLLCSIEGELCSCWRQSAELQTHP
jgi:hypothetical protein